MRASFDFSCAHLDEFHCFVLGSCWRSIMSYQVSHLHVVGKNLGAIPHHVFKFFSASKLTARHVKNGNLFLSTMAPRGP